MTKYVLNSGGLKNQQEKTKQFLAEIVKDLGSHPKILLCFFAAGREYWETKFAEHSARFGSMAPQGVELSFELAFPDTFEDQIQKSDAIMIQGGDDHLLKYWLSKFDIPKIWAGKVVAGSSAGSDVLCESYWTCDWRHCMNGLGIVPIRFIPHYKSTFGATDPRGPIDWDVAYKELSEYGDTSLPIHALQEGDYIVVQQ